MKKYGIILALLLCLLLAACGDAEQDSRSRMSFLGQASGLEEDAVLLTVDGREVSAWRYLYWLGCSCDALWERYESAGIPLEWDMPMGGCTLAEYAREQALADTVLYATVENRAEQFGCTLGDQDLAELETIWTTLAAEHGGEEAWLQELADQGLDRVRAEELAGVGLLYGKLCALAQEEGSSLRATEGELSSFAKEQGYLSVEQLLFPAGENRETARQQAEEAFAKLNGAEDRAAVFQELLAQQVEGSGTVCTFRPGDGTLAPSLEAAAQALGEEQHSGILEYEAGYVILRSVPVDGSALAVEHLDAQLRLAVEQAVVEPAALYEKLDVGAFYRELSALRSAK